MDQLTANEQVDAPVQPAAEGDHPMWVNRETVDATPDDLRSVDRLMTPVPQGTRVLCNILRRKDALGYYTYELFVEETSRRYSILMVTKKRSKTSFYGIFISDRSGRAFNQISRTQGKAVAYVRSNFIGTEFSIYCHGISHSKFKPEKDTVGQLRRELAAVTYETNFLGHKGPRKMMVVLPATTPNQPLPEIRPKNVTPIHVFTIACFTFLTICPSVFVCRIGME